MSTSFKTERYGFLDPIWYESPPPSMYISGDLSYEENQAPSDILRNWYLPSQFDDPTGVLQWDEVGYMRTGNAQYLLPFSNNNVNNTHLIFQYGWKGWLNFGLTQFQLSLNGGASNPRIKIYHNVGNILVMDWIDNAGLINRYTVATPLSVQLNHIGVCAYRGVSLDIFLNFSRIAHITNATWTGDSKTYNVPYLDMNPDLLTDHKPKYFIWPKPSRAVSVANWTQAKQEAFFARLAEYE
ncbi:MAG: hypothetical protein ACW964_15795 [Candidatus Hodarchaeales archaeon]|jgi:hypothetical protein